MAGKGGLAGAVKLVVKTFLEQQHYQDLHKHLSEEWSHCHSLTAAVRLMEAHGVHITPEREAKLAEMPEDRMIDALVLQMPQQSKEQFQHFFLQLSLIASTTTRLRSALETGNSEAVEEVLEQAENVGILQYILKMSVAQAGNEVKSHDNDLQQWLAVTRDRMSPLLQSQAQAATCQKALAQAKSELGMNRADANEKSKKVLMGLVGGQNEALKATSFHEWADLIKRQKKEASIREEYEDEIKAAEKKLHDYIDKQLSIMRNMLNSKSEEGMKLIMLECFHAFSNEVEERKRGLAGDEEMKRLEEQLKSFGAEQAAKSKKVLSRMNAGNDQGLMHMCYTAWVQHLEDYRKNKDVEDAVKAKEKMVADFMAKQNEGAKSVLSRMSSGSDSALVQQCFKGWVELWTEIKKAQEMEDLMAGHGDRFKSFNNKNKAAAGNAQQRSAALQDEQVIIIMLLFWKRHVKVTKMIAYAKEKNSKKKAQLIGVKGLFKNFANELESGLKAGTPRVEDLSPSRPMPAMTDEGAA